MKKTSLIMVLSLVFIMSIALQAQATPHPSSIDFSATKTGLAASDGNYLINSFNNGHVVDEDYNATQLISFTPLVLPAGATAVNAVVDFTTGGVPIYFTKELIFGDKDSGKEVEVNFHVDNTTKYNWTNYEFIITNAPSGVILVRASNNSSLKGEQLDATHLEYYADKADQFTAPGKQDNFNFKLQLPTIADGTYIAVDITQVATANAVPIPPSALLLGSGLLGLGLVRLRRRA